MSNQEAFQDFKRSSGNAMSRQVFPSDSSINEPSSSNTAHLTKLRKQKLDAQREKMKKRMNKRHSVSRDILGPNMPSAASNGPNPFSKRSSNELTSASLKPNYNEEPKASCDKSFAQSVPISPNQKARKEALSGIAQSFNPRCPENIANDRDLVDMNDPVAFLQTPLPKGLTLQCYIERCKSGLKQLHPAYELFLKENDEFLLAAKKRPQNKTSNYVISMDRGEVDKFGTGYLGKLRSNFVGTEFILYDNGLNPVNHKTASKSTIRQELAGVIYQSNILGSRGPRKMRVLLPKMELGEAVVFRPPSTPSLIKSFQNGKVDNLMVMANRAPKWNEQVGAYVLNFNGRVTMASVKNFQLIFEDDEDNVIMQFGRVDKNKFTMDFKHPLTPLQAFAICLSSFDYKLVCE